MKITDQWLEKHSACSEAREWVKTQKNRDFRALVNTCIASESEEKLSWANWGMARDGRTYDCGDEPILIVAPDDIRSAAGF